MKNNKLAEIKAGIAEIRKRYDLPNISSEVMLSLGKSNPHEAIQSMGVLASQLVHEAFEDNDHDKLLSAIVAYARHLETGIYFVNGVLRKQYLLDLFPRLTTTVMGMDKKEIKNLSECLVKLAAKRGEF
jgi:hypothetical protein